MTVAAFFIIFFIPAVFIGAWGDVVMSACRAKPSMIFRISFGGCMTILTALIASTLCGILNTSAAVCLYVASAMILAAGVSGVIVRSRSDDTVRYEPYRPAIGDTGEMAVYVIPVVLAVFAAMYFRYGGIGPIRHTGIATAVYDSGKVLCSDPMMVFIGCIANVTGIHPMRIMYTLLPAPLITLYGLCYIALINTVCSARRTRITAYVAICVLNVWGYQSECLTQTNLLLSWFGIWVFVIHGLLNIAAVITIGYIQNRPDDGNTEKSEENRELSEEWDMNTHKMVNARNLAIALGVLTLALIGVVLFLNHKINMLYDATVNLQTDMNNRCSLYEFVTDEGKVEGYLIKGSDGSLSFVGGGSSENADEIELFITRYGTHISNWYVYGDDEENAGAMKKITGSHTVDADRIYVIDRKEIVNAE